MGSSSAAKQASVWVVGKDGRLTGRVDDMPFAIGGVSSDAGIVADTADSGYDLGQSWDAARIGRAASVLHVAPDYNKRMMVEPASGASNPLFEYSSYKISRCLRVPGLVDLL
jgi:hypothetical protein